MSVVKHFIEDSIKKAEIDEFLRNEFERAGYGGVSITKTPLGTHLVVYTMRPGLVIGRGGETIRELAVVLEEKFQLPSPQISVAEIEIPELNAHVVASRIASALKRGVHYRRAGFWGLNQTMEAGALGAEVIISGKLRTDRARYEKFRAGYLPKSGEPPRKYMRTAELHVQLKPGILGVKVRIIPPDAQFPDQVKIQILEEVESETEGEIVEEKVVAEEKVAETAVTPVEEEVKKDKKAEPAAPTAEGKAEVKEKVAKPEVPSAKEESVEKKVTEPAVPVEEKTVAKKKVAGKKVSKLKEKAKTKEKKAEPVAPPVKKKKVTKKTSKPKASAEKKKETKKKATKQKTAKSKTPTAKEKAVAKKKKAKSKVSPAKEKKKVEKKKKPKSKVPSTKKAKKAGK
jgi:small subunit ribosomal protein S3